MATAPVSHGRSRSVLSRRIAWLGTALVLAAALAYACAPRRGDLAAFQPEAAAQAETAMWRHYYEKRYLALFADLYGLIRSEYGLSPLDSVLVAYDAARAAQSFQPTKSRAEADAALPWLIAYFGRLSHAAPQPFDVAKAARTELDWWQARREAVPPETYGLTIARVTTLLYGTDGDAIRESGRRRAAAMAYRDAHADGITEADWAQINEQLDASYRLLKQGVSRAGS